jgi:hypothetical protein
MFTHLVMLVRGLTGNQSTAHSMSRAEQLLVNVNSLRAKFTQICLNVQALVSPKHKRKTKTAQLITAVKLPKPVKKSAQAEHGQTGKSKTLVRLTPQRVKPAPKVKRSLAK